MAKKSDQPPIDEIDRHTLAILAKDPRLPYADIADEGFKMSSEAIRQRVSSLLELTTNFYLLRPESHEWEVVAVIVQTMGDGNQAGRVRGPLRDELLVRREWLRDGRHLRRRDSQLDQ